MPISKPQEIKVGWNKQRKKTKSRIILHIEIAAHTTKFVKFSFWESISNEESILQSRCLLFQMMSQVAGLSSSHLFPPWALGAVSFSLLLLWRDSLTLLYNQFPTFLPNSTDQFCCNTLFPPPQSYKLLIPRLLLFSEVGRDSGAITTCVHPHLSYLNMISLEKSWCC